MKRLSSTPSKKELPLGEQSRLEWAGKKRSETLDLAVNQSSGYCLRE